MRLWIDTDVGDNPDDAVALLCAAAHPDVELVGVSTTGGRTEWRAELAREFVAADVIAGEHPDELARRLAAASPMRCWQSAPSRTWPRSWSSGCRSLHSPSWAGCSYRYGTGVGSAGWSGTSRKIPRPPRWSSPARKTTVVPLDVTVAMRLEPAVLDQLVAAAPKLVPEIERWIAEQDEPVVLHDPLALLVALGESFVTVEPRVFSVDATDGTVREGEGGHEHAVVVSVDAPAAVDRVLGLLG